MEDRGDMRPPEHEMQQQDDDRRRDDPVNPSPVPERDEAMNREQMTHRDEPMKPSPMSQQRDTTSSSSDMADFKTRFEHLQVDFIDDPKETVSKAEKLVEEAVERMVSSMHERVNRIHNELGDGNDDTERLRVAMRSYREFMDDFVRGRAA